MPLLAHLADYTPATDPAAACCLHTASPHAPRCRSITSTIGCIPFACAPPLPLLAPLPCRCLRPSPAIACAPRPAAAHICRRPLIAPSLHVHSQLHAYLTTACAHLPAAAQRMHNPPPLHVYPATAYAPSPCCSSVLDACPAAPQSRTAVASVPRCSPCSLLQPVLPATARAPCRSPHTCCPFISLPLMHPTAARL
ncbi:hypothetical protein B0H14DRAFT_3451805 [Mycena olivaceomarginata]|nr:hypothetical protein B0H14DRAFT_3451805 [Mycena olivaceomarginata]